MAIPEGTADFENSLHDVNEALDALTATLGEVRGCEYPRLIAREIQALIVACMAHDRAKHEAVNGAAVPDGAGLGHSAVADTARLTALLVAREAELSRLRDLLHHGVDTIEAHTLTTPDGTAVMLHGDYQCISAAAIEQWVRRAEAALHNEGPSSR